MCMLSYFNPGTQPDTDELWHGADANPDGHGWAIVDARQRRITIEKSMNPDQAIESFANARKVNDSGPALFHSRIATSGLVDITGVHPFRVGADNRTVVAHNGVLFHTSGKRSDTRVFAEDIMPLRFAALDRGRTMRKLQKWAGIGNKFVVLSVNPVRKKHGYIINQDRGMWSSTSGAWHSNSDYLGFSSGWRRGKVQSYSYLWDGDQYIGREPLAPPWERSPDNGMSPWPCEVCNSFNSIDKHTNTCEVCGCCNDCLTHETECMCYMPASVKRESTQESTELARLVALDR